MLKNGPPALRQGTRTLIGVERLAVMCDGQEELVVRGRADELLGEPALLVAAHPLDAGGQTVAVLVALVGAGDDDGRASLGEFVELDDEDQRLHQLEDPKPPLLELGIEPLEDEVRLDGVQVGGEVAGVADHAGKSPQTQPLVNGSEPTSVQKPTKGGLWHRSYVIRCHD